MKTRTLRFILILLLASYQFVHAQNTSEDESQTLTFLNNELGWAAKNGDIEKINELLAAGVDVDVLVDGAHTPLMFAVYYGHYEIAKILIGKGANVNAAHSIDHTVLYHALESRRLCTEIIQLLVEAGVKMDYRPITWAIQYLTLYRNNEAQEIMALLIEAGADVNERDQLGIPVIVNAACRGSNQFIDILLNSGADINASVGLSGRTALMCAVEWKRIETVKLLIEVGADLEMADNQGNTPLMIAKSNGSEEIIELLMEAGAVK
jgi:ankyrin repeat protein